MAFDDVIDKKQGSIKTSENFTDRALDIINTAVGESGIKVLEQLVKINADALRRINYILLSDGRMRWDGTTLWFDSDSRANDMVFRLLQTEDVGGVLSPRTIDLKLKGSTTGNTTNRFESIAINNNELIYLELQRETILAAVSGTVELENAVGGGSVVSGYTVKKVPLSAVSGMPALLSPNGGNSQTFYIPLCLRHDWTDGIDTYQDLLWPAHGIRWPMGISSTVGEVIVRGLETLPSTYVRTQQELIDAITEFSAAGGIILVSTGFNIDTSITIPDGITLRSRSNLDGGGYTLGFVPGGKLILGNRAVIKDINFVGNTFFGLNANEWMIQMSNNGAWIENCQFSFNRASGGVYAAYGINVSGANNRIIRCKFLNVVSISYKWGINYSAGNNNVDIDSIFT